MDPLYLIALALRLIEAARSALGAGRREVTEDEIDAALAEIAAGDQRLTDAIRRAREREAGEN